MNGGKNASNGPVRGSARALTRIIRRAVPTEAADTQNLALVNVAADAAAASSRNTRFRVIDLGKGRVALKAAYGRGVAATNASFTISWASSTMRCR